MNGGRSIDCIYVAGSSRDGRFTRICVASLRYFYPEVPIRLLAGGRLERGLVEELRRCWGVELADIPSGEYGWGFVKLEPLFGRAGERFLVLDSDTVITGPVLDIGKSEAASLLVDDEQQSEADTKRLYYDWEKVYTVAPQTRPPQFVFNSGQWFGTAGVLKRQDFTPWLDWSMPRRLRYPEMFMPGEQGVLNLVLNERARDGRLQIARVPLMRWSGHGLDDFAAEAVASRSCPPRVIHWAGVKAPRLSRMTGADLLMFFERAHYRRLAAGPVRRILGAGLYVTRLWKDRLHEWLSLAFRRLAARTPLPARRTA